MYKGRLEQFFIANDIKEDEKQKKAELLNTCAENTYILLRNLCVPNIPESKTYEELTALLDKHGAPDKADFAARVVFYKPRRQKAEILMFVFYKK